MLQYKTPGVYIEEINSLPPAVTAVETAIPVFIGYTGLAKSSPLYRVPTRIASWLEYLTLFGNTAPTLIEVIVTETVQSGATINTKVELHDKTLIAPALYMYYSIQHYFSNGGGPCYILSVGNAVSALDSGAAAEDKFDLKHFLGGTIGAITFKSVYTILEEYDEPTLIVIPDACSFRGETPATPDLTKYKSIINAALAHCRKMKDRFTIIDVLNASTKFYNAFVALQTDFNDGFYINSATKVTDLFRTGVGLSQDECMYGAAYFPYLKSSLSFYTTDAKVSVKTHNIITSGVTTTGPTEGKALTFDFGTVPLPAPFEKKYNSIYNAVKSFVASLPVTIPPSGAIAGVYASTDRVRGVWKAPANVGLAQVIEPSFPINLDFNDQLNSDPTGKSVNAIKSFTGKGTLVWGARTLNANDLNWRFVNVRREVIFIEESVQKALEGFVFEPNTANTWTKVKAMVDNFLSVIWRQGGLAGAKAEDAFEVNIGVNSTMTPEEVAQGIMIVEIVLVPPRPAEVIVLRVSQKLQVS